MRTFWLHTTAGSDDWDGKDKKRPKATFSSIFSEIADNNWSLIRHIGGNINVNVVATRPFIYKGPGNPWNLDSPSYWPGASDTNPALDTNGKDIIIDGGIFYNSAQDNKPFVKVSGDTIFSMKSGILQFLRNGQIGIDFQGGSIRKLEDCLFIPQSLMTGGYYILHNGEIFPGEITDNLFLWDSVNGLGSETNICQDNISGGSYCRYDNNLYIDFDFVASIITAVYDTPDVYPTGANRKDRNPKSTIDEKQVQFLRSLVTGRYTGGQV